VPLQKAHENTHFVKKKITKNRLGAKLELCP